jgi:hypothetical protein
MAEIAKVLGDWNKWFTEYLAKYNKQLDVILGAAPADDGQWAVWSKYYMFDTYAKGAASIAPRLGLTKEQDEAIQKLFAETQAEVRALNAPLGAAVRADQSGKGNAQALWGAIGQKCADLTNERFRQGLDKILTQDQRDKLTVACGLLDERNKGMAAPYAEFAAKISKIAPLAQRKADAPYIMQAPGGGVNIILPGAGLQKTGAPGEPAVVPATGEKTIIIIGEGAEGRQEKK